MVSPVLKDTLRRVGALDAAKTAHSQQALIRRTVRSRVRNPILRRRYIQRSIEVETKCPACDADSTGTLSVPFEGDTLEKFICADCGHFFHFLNLPDNPEEADEIFSYDEPPTRRVKAQRSLLQLARNHTESVEPAILDFGVGRNSDAYQSMNDSNAKGEYWGCDIVHLELENYFCAYRESPGLSFDAIVSNNTIEHIDDTAEAWQYMNSLLKPVAEGRSKMFHSFPMQLHYPLDEWPCVGEGHCCIFSKKSLNQICRRAGFELTSIRYRPFTNEMPNAGFPIFEFEKVSDVTTE